MGLTQPMKPTQQRFWADAQPLVEQLGREFFRQLPETPGIYQMRDATDAVLYVGKAKNIRHRLCSYRVANPERMARRTLRLLNLVKKIIWEECADEMTALRREAELLLKIKPRFNRAGVWQGPKRFLAWRCQSAGLELAMIDPAETDWVGAGSFGAQTVHLHRTLVRLCGAGCIRNQAWRGCRRAGSTATMERESSSRIWTRGGLRKLRNGWWRWREARPRVSYSGSRRWRFPLSKRCAMRTLNW